MITPHDFSDLAEEQMIKAYSDLYYAYLENVATYSRLVNKHLELSLYIKRLFLKLK